MLVSVCKRAYWLCSFALVVWIYLPLALVKGFALRYGTEALYVWFILAVPPMVLVELAVGLVKRLRLPPAIVTRWNRA